MVENFGREDSLLRHLCKTGSCRIFQYLSFAKIVIPMKFLLPSFFCIALFFSACEQQKPFDPEVWYNINKEIILRQASQPTDSVERRNWGNEVPEREFFYRKGKLVRETRYRDTGVMAIEKFYSNDGRYELRREFCTDGSVSFEGIFYKSFGYGLSTWWGCGVPSQERGVRVKDKKIGNWLSIDAKGVQGRTEFGNEQELEILKGMSVPE